MRIHRFKCNLTKATEKDVNLADRSRDCTVSDTEHLVCRHLQPGIMLLTQLSEKQLSIVLWEAVAECG